MSSRPVLTGWPRSARFGANEIWITKDGYTDLYSVVELPRPLFEDPGTERDHGHVQYWLDRPFELHVRLEGWEQLGPIGDFGVGGPPHHERTPFNVEGLATLQIEYGFHPLPLKLWTASGGTGIYYLDSAFPGNGDTYVIDLDEGSNVSVDLRLSDEVEAALTDSDCVLSVNYRTDGGDAVTRGPSTTVSGIYEIPGVQAGAATVSFDMNLADGRVGSCAFADMEVSDGVDATCVLNVESLPVPVTVRGLNESPLANVATEVVPRGFRTPWVTGGMTDEEGRVFLPSSGPEDLLFRAVWDRRTEHQLPSTSPCNGTRWPTSGSSHSHPLTSCASSSRSRATRCVGHHPADRRRVPHLSRDRATCGRRTDDPPPRVSIERVGDRGQNGLWIRTRRLELAGRTLLAAITRANSSSQRPSASERVERRVPRIARGLGENGPGRGESQSRREQDLSRRLVRSRHRQWRCGPALPCHQGPGHLHPLGGGRTGPREPRWSRRDGVGLACSKMHPIRSGHLPPSVTTRRRR